MQWWDQAQCIPPASVSSLDCSSGKQSEQQEFYSLCGGAQATRSSRDPLSLWSWLTQSQP